MTTDIQIFMPALTIEQATERYNALVSITKNILQRGIDYGAVAGSKDTLLKPGAEKLCSQFGLLPRLELTDCIKDWQGTQHGGEPLFYFEYRCKLYRGDIQVGEGGGSCNSWEQKYRYRKASIRCPSCGSETIIRSKYPPKNAPRDDPPGWYCNPKGGGCGKSYGANEPAIVQQPRGNVPNTNVFDQVNTIDKMAQKRALIAAVLVATGASEFFTQDIEDLYPHAIEGEVVEVHEPEPVASYEPPRQERQRSRNGKKAPPAEQPESEQQQLLGTLVEVQNELKERGYKRQGDEPKVGVKSSPDELADAITFWTKRLAEHEQMQQEAAEIDAAA